MTFDQNSLEKIEEIISNFIPQTKSDMCLSACILNIINELGIRLEIKGLKYSLKEINRLCDYRNGILCYDSIIPKVISGGYHK